MAMLNKNQIDTSFIQRAADILAETDSPLSGNKIVSLCTAYAYDFNRSIPYSKYPNDAPNKRTMLRDNLCVFEAKEQFKILKDFCELPDFSNNETVHELKIKLFQNYGQYAEVKLSDSELIIKTKHWLENHPLSLKQYQSSLTKFEGGIFERNTLDDMRLALELLLKDLLYNDKSLENQYQLLGQLLQTKAISSEIRNLIISVLRYYADFQNHNVKHNEQINKNEIEYVIEQTSVIMKFLITVLEA